MQPALDFFSGSFDPLLALGSSSAQPPVPHAAPLDNLHQCRRLLLRDHADYMPPRAAAPRDRDAVSAPRMRSSLALLWCALASAALKSNRAPPQVAVAEKDRAKLRVSYLRQQQARQRCVPCSCVCLCDMPTAAASPMCMTSLPTIWLQGA